MKHALFLALSLVLAATAIAEPVIETITPGFGPSSGGTEVTITGQDFLPHVVCLLPCPTTVTFGDITVPVTSETERSVTVITPAHVPGTVDVILTVAGENPVTREDGFRFDPSGDDLYEVVLLPIHLDGIVPGAFGTQWKTDLWLRNGGQESATLAPWICQPGEVCPAIFPMTKTLEPGKSIHNLPPFESPVPDPGNPARLLYIHKPVPKVSFNLRFSDLSRSTLDRGDEMPVIREADLLTTTSQLQNVPLSSASRVLLRIYDVEYNSSAFHIAIYPQTENADAAVHHVFVNATRSESGEFRSKPSYAAVDISALLNLEKVWPQIARIEVEPQTPGSRYWAFVSITSNDTQSVTLVTPQ